MPFSSTRNDPLSSVFLVWFKLFTNSLFFHLAFGSVSLALFMIAKIMTSDTKKSILIKNPFIAAQRDRSPFGGRFPGRRAVTGLSPKAVQTPACSSARISLSSSRVVGILQMVWMYW